jgi:hypothetical protein
VVSPLTLNETPPTDVVLGNERQRKLFSWRSSLGLHSRVLKHKGNGSSMREADVRSQSNVRKGSAKQRTLLVGLATLVVACGLAACGSSATTTHPGTGGKAATTPTTQCTIPQNNGGDHDADNNGAPSDGDACDQ